MDWLRRGLLALAASLALAACGGGETVTENAEPHTGPQLSGQRAEAYFAGGCFWCMESDFEHLDGVYEAVSGYAGGTLQNPTYENHEGHFESVRVVYDPTMLSYDDLLNYYWRHIDPTDGGGQFCDRGHSYQSAIFVADDAQRTAAEASKASTQQTLGQPVVTEVLPFTRFWEAEDYHQDYYKKNPLRYRYYRTACGRDARVADVWRGH